MPEVLVIAGTADARQIIGRLSERNIKVAATVTTQFGSELLGSSRNVEVFEGKLDSKGMVQLISKMGIRCIIDASHPFALQASVNAIDASRQSGIPYLRFERSRTDTGGMELIKAKSFEEAAEIAVRIEGNILLTTGSNTIEIFTERISDYKDRLFARVLPDSKVILRCEKAGLSANNIFALKGPFTEGMNIEILKHCKARAMVTKDSGETGGTNEKLSAAFKLGVKVILVERPDIDYIQGVSSFEEVEVFVNSIFGIDY